MTTHNTETRQAILSHLRAAEHEVTAVSEASSAAQEDTAKLLQFALQFEEAAGQAAELMRSAFAHYANATEHEREAAVSLRNASSPPMDAILAGLKGGLAMSVILSSVKRVEEANIGYQSISVFSRIAEGLTEVDRHLQDGIVHSQHNLNGSIKVLAQYDK